MKTARACLILLPTFLLLSFAEARAATLARYAFTSSTLGPTTSASAAITASAVTFGSGSSRYGVTEYPHLLVVNTTVTNVPSSLAPAAVMTAPVAASSYFEFTITPAAGRTLYLTSLTFDTAAGSIAGVGIRSSVDGYTSDLQAAWLPTQYPTWAGLTVDLSGAAFQGLTSAVTFRVYTWTAVTSGVAAAAYDNITVNGTTNIFPQTIAGFAASPSSGNVGGSSTLSVVSSGASGNAVVFSSSTTGVCTVSGSTVSYVTVGTCSVAANQAGDDFFDPAEQVSVDITVGKGTQAITGFGATPSSGTALGSSILSVTGAGASGDPIVYGSSPLAVCTVSGNTLTYVAAGTCTVTANQAGNVNYDAAPPVSFDITVGKASQTITGLAASPSTGTVGGTSTLSVSGSGASGNAVTYLSSTTSVCTVSSNTVTFVAAGTCTVTANQAGNAAYDAAAAASLSITVEGVPVPALGTPGWFVLLAVLAWLGVSQIRRRPPPGHPHQHASVNSSAAT